MEFKTWKTIKLGTGLKTGDDFRKALNEAGRPIPWGCEKAVNNILYDSAVFKVAAEETEVELVNVSLTELGLPKGVIYNIVDPSPRPGNQLYNLVQDLGLDLCSAEVGPQLCLQYLDPPIIKEAESLNIGMEPVITTVGVSWERIISIFMIYNKNGELSLMTTKGGNQQWASTKRFVFQKRN